MRTLRLILLLMVTPVSDAAKLPPAPDSIAQVEVKKASSTQNLVLTEVKTFEGKVLSTDANAHQEQPSTNLVPALEKGEGTVIWLIGYDLGELNEPGDTRNTYSLLLELHEGGRAKALWYEDHMEVPHSFFMGEGAVLPGAREGVMTFTLKVLDVEYGDEVELIGVWRAS